MQLLHKQQTRAEILEQLFTLYCNKMYGIAFSILHDEMQAEDAVGDAYEKMIPYLDKCKNAESTKTKHLLTKLVKNAAIDIYRKNKRNRGNISIEEQDYLIDQNDPIEEYLQSTANNELISLLKNMLPDHYWQVIELRYIRNMSVEEIATELNMNEKSVYTRLQRARKKAKELLLEVS